MTGTPRQRARAQAIEDIKRIAKEQLAQEGSAALSLRAIARELGIVSSAVYRYVPSRDDLLTMLIVDAYNSLGDAVEAAEGTCERDDLRGRWTAMASAARTWAVERPSEYALIYGSPVPGYQAPRDTVEPAIRVILLIGKIVGEAAATGEIEAGEPIGGPLGADLASVAQQVAPGAPPQLVSHGLAAWIHLCGAVSAELFGQLNNTITARREFFELQMRGAAAIIARPV